MLLLSPSCEHRCQVALIRMRSLDAARLQGRFVVALDATGHLAFRRQHCPHCLVYRHETHTSYLHQVLEAKYSDRRV